MFTRPSRSAADPATTAPPPPTAMVANARSEAIEEDSPLPPFAARLAMRYAGIHVQTAYSSHLY